MITKLNKELFNYAQEILSSEELKMNGLKLTLESRISMLEEHIKIMEDEFKKYAEGNSLFIKKLNLELRLAKALLNDYEENTEDYLNHFEEYKYEVH
jgi:RNA recognition motif-containing protein